MAFLFYSKIERKIIDWPYTVLIQNHNWRWTDVSLWLENNIGHEGGPWVIGRYNIGFLYHEHYVMFQMVWC